MGEAEVLDGFHSHDNVPLDLGEVRLFFDLGEPIEYGGVHSADGAPGEAALS
jgi:hypothetical protein